MTKKGKLHFFAKSQFSIPFLLLLFYINTNKGPPKYNILITFASIWCYFEIKMPKRYTFGIWILVLVISHFLVFIGVFIVEQKKTNPSVKVSGSYSTQLKARLSRCWEGFRKLGFSTGCFPPGVHACMCELINLFMFLWLLINVCISKNRIIICREGWANSTASFSLLDE